MADAAAGPRDQDRGVLTTATAPSGVEVERLRLARTRAQRLTDATAITGGVDGVGSSGAVAEVVRTLVGIQAQAMPAATLAVRARSRGLLAADVLRARNEEHSIVRTWVMRGTLHLVAREDVRWLVALLGPVSEARGRSRRRQLGIDERTSDHAMKVIANALAGGPLTRKELIDRLAARGIAFEPRSQGPIHLLAQAALCGLTCYGPDRGGRETFVLMDDWIGTTPAPSRASAPAELARRYFAGHGPATAMDFAAWSGLPVKVAADAVREDGDSGAAQVAARRTRSSSVRLVPAFDEYLLGYASRGFAVSSALERRLQRGGGWIHPAVIVDGRGVGAWRIEQAGRRLDLRIELFERAPPAVRTAIDAEVKDVGRYLERETRAVLVSV